MAEFGLYPRHESRVYTVPVEQRAVPVSLHLRFAEGSARDFVFVPEVEMVKLFPDSFKGFSHSAAFGSIFRYLGVGGTELRLGGAASFPVSRRREFRFALVKWDRSATQSFPHAVHCVQEVPYGYRGLAMREIVPVSSVVARAAEGASK